MNNPIDPNVPPELSEADALAELALNLRETWNHRADELWGRIDREIELSGRLDDAQKARLLQIAEQCPVHRTLKSEINIRTSVL